MSPDELFQHRLEQLERDVRALQGRGELETVDAAVHAAAVLEHAKQLRELWLAIEKLRNLLMGVLATVTGGAVLAAIAAVIKAGGGP